MKVPYTGSGRKEGAGCEVLSRVAVCQTPSLSHHTQCTSDGLSPSEYAQNHGKHQSLGADTDCLAQGEDSVSRPHRGSKMDTGGGHCQSGQALQEDQLGSAA